MAPENVEKRLQAVVPSSAPYEVVHKTAYKVHERVASKYVEGRIFLAGDAAHINNPLGGMGMRMQWLWNEGLKQIRISILGIA